MSSCERMHSQRGLLPALALLCLSVPVFLDHAGVEAGPSFAKRQIVYPDIPTQFESWLENQGINAGNFTAHTRLINDRTAEREVQGEYDHLINFMLQSGRFTKQPRIEPALSAHQFVNSLNDPEREKYLAEGSTYLPPGKRVPDAVRRRMTDFIKASARQSDDERMSYFGILLGQRADRALPLEERLFSEYARAMRFLYRKEFASKTVKKENLAAYVASLYHDRGHSTDTQIEANFAVYIALASLKAQSPSTQLSKVLIIGPGLDFAPRTDLIDLFGPQSYQPFAVADALLSLKLAEAARLQIHCVDINERVINHLKQLRKKKQATLSILSGVGDSAAHPLTGEFKDYFRSLGREIGSETGIEAPAGLKSRLRKSLKVRPEIIETFSADRLNIITHRYEPSPGYDLIVVTNVFPYFKITELLFALTNIAAMMTEGGYLIHNELQAVPSSFVTPLGLPLQMARTVLIASGDGAPLYDGIAIHRKEVMIKKKLSAKQNEVQPKRRSI